MGFFFHAILARFGITIGEPDMIEFDAAWACWVLNDGGRDYFHGRIQQLEYAFAGGHGRLQDVVFFTEVHDGAEEAERVLDEGDQYAERGHGGYQSERDQRFPVETHGDAGDAKIAYHVASAKPDDACNRDSRKDFYDRVVNRVGHDRVFVCVHVV